MNLLLNSGRKFIRSGVSAPIYLITLSVLIFIIYVLKHPSENGPGATGSAIAAAPEAPASSSSYKIIRQGGYDLIKPVLISETGDEDKELNQLAETLKTLSYNLKQQGKTTSMSVYLRRMSSVYPVVINGSEQYSPGSLFKLPLLIAYLKKAETENGLLNEKLTLPPHQIKGIKQHFTTEPLVTGKSYTIRELLTAMIVESSNDAVLLLLNNIEYSRIKEIFSSLDIVPPQDINSTINITASNYSKFLQVLYNATYLSRANSEYALSLMLKCNFKTGITRNIPSEIKVAHKFGESGNDDDPQLHEAGIFYFQNNPYTLVVMTKGKNLKILSDVMSEVSDVVFNYLRNSNL